MPDSITPALTPEEWKDVQTRLPKTSRTLSVVAKMFSEKRWPAMIAIVADMADYFAWEDVDRLRAGADYIEGADASQSERAENEGDASHLRALAERIAALLPPRQR